MVTEPVNEATMALFRVLSHPVRTRIVELPGERDLIVHKLLDAIAVESTKLSQQLAVLRRVGLVRHQRLDGEVVCSLVEPALGDLPSAARQVRSVALAGQAGRERDLPPTIWDDPAPAESVPGATS